MNVSNDFLAITLKLFQYYKSLGDGALEQIGDKEISFRPNPESNNISILVGHLSGNMRSRFTDFLRTDGEKDWRNRDAEFTDHFADKAAMMVAWESGWNCLFKTIESLHPDDLGRTVYIRQEAHTVLEAISRQLTHYAAHVGQILYLGKIIKGQDWRYLSTPPGRS